MGMKFAYVGIDGAYLNGIPARDISEAEYEQLSDEAKQTLSDNMQSDHSLYRVPTVQNDTPSFQRRARRNVHDVETPAAEPVDATLLSGFATNE